MPGNDAQLARIEEQVKTIFNKVGRICTLLEGDGGDGVPGIIKDVDRLKQSETRRKWITGAIFTGVVTLIGERLAAFFH
jgi:hypothetical protein